MAPVFAAAPGRERLGLALSGGGLRAAFFHAGVLARLADLGRLKEVDIISTVSGGSIVGALYVLHLARRGGAEHREAVAATIADLERVAELDLRASTFRNPLKTLWMGNPFQDSYSRSDRIAELYDRYLYRQFAPPPVGSGLRHRLRLALEDYVGPWRHRPRAVLAHLEVPGRRPWLMINATVLNTGHPWRFEPDKFGEPLRDPEHRFVDRNARLPRPQSAVDEHLDPKYHEFDVASAVAASACFPGFQPMAMTGLYADWRPELADGGIYDNQGLEALVHRGCTGFIVSDGSGQMEDVKKPGTDVLSVLFRAFSIASGSSREDHLRELIRAEPSTAIPHLRAGAAPAEVAWAGDEAPAADAEEDGTPFPDDPAEWGVHREIQMRLAAVRTDLDAFTEIERRSLMLDGYRLAQAQLERPGGLDEGAEVPADAEAAWPFASVAPHLAAGDEELRRQLGIAKSRFFKYVRILGPLGGAAYVAVVLGGLYALVAFATGEWGWPWSAVLDRRPPVWTWLLAGVAAGLSWKFFQPPLRSLIWGLIPAVGVPAVWWHLTVNRWLYLRLGRVSRLT